MQNVAAGADKKLTIYDQSWRFEQLERNKSQRQPLEVVIIFRSRAGAVLLHLSLSRQLAGFYFGVLSWNICIIPGMHTMFFQRLFSASRHECKDLWIVPIDFLF